jgi:hypothetical protein
MSAGLLQFTLGLDSKQFQGAMTGANQGTGDLIKNMSQAGATTGVMTRTATQGFREMRESVRSTNELTRAFGGTISLLGYSTFPQLTAAVEIAVQTIKGLTGAAQVAGLSFGALGVGAAGVGAALEIVYSGYEMIAAQLGEIKSSDALESQYEVLRDKLIPELEKAMKLGRLDVKTGVGLENMLKDSNTPDRQRAALKAAQEPLIKNAREDRQYTVGQQLAAMEKTMSNQYLLTGPARDKALFSQEQDEKLKVALDLAHRAGQPEQPVVDFFNKVTQAKYSEIDKSYADKKKKEEPPPPQMLRPEQHSALERMGFVFKGGHANDTHAHTRKIAENSEKTVGLLRQIAGGNPHQNPFGATFKLTS